MSAPVATWETCIQSFTYICKTYFASDVDTILKDIISKKDHLPQYGWMLFV